MKTIDIKANLRGDLSKAASKQLRAEQNVPAVIYGGGEATSIYISYKDAKRVLYTLDTYIVNLEVDGEVKQAIVREAQYHPVTEKILHIDFFQVAEGKAIEIVLPITLKGTPKGVVTGGRLMTKMRKLKVKGVPANLPSDIPVDVSELELGQSIKVSDLELDGIEITAGLSAAIASVEIPRALRSAGAEGEEGEEGVEGEEGEVTEEASEE